MLTAAAYLTGCGSDSSTSGSTGVDGCVSEVPSETSGPYPADGSQGNGLYFLDRTGIVRSDIRTSLGTGNTAEGVLATVQLTLVDVNNDCAPLVGYAVYLWRRRRRFDHGSSSRNRTGRNRELQYDRPDSIDFPTEQWDKPGLPGPRSRIVRCVHCRSSGLRGRIGRTYELPIQ